MKKRTKPGLIVASAIMLTAMTHPSVGQEILENTSFEENGGYTPWIPHNSTGAIEWQGQSGSRSLYIKDRAGTNFGVRQDIQGEISLGQSLNASAWVKLKDGSQSAQSKILILKKDANGWAWDPVAETSTNGWEWLNLQGSWTADWSGTLEHLSLCVAGPDASIEMLIDDVTASVSGSTFTPPAAGTQLLVNPDMESATGNVDPWITDNATAVLEWQGYSGSRSAHVSALSTSYEYGLSQSLMGLLAQGQTIDLSAWVKLKTGSASSSSTMYVVLEDDDGWTWEPIATEGTNGWSWTELSGSWTAAWNGTLDSLSVYVEGPADKSAMLLDDVTATVSGQVGSVDVFTGVQHPVCNCGNCGSYTYSAAGNFAYWTSGTQDFWRSALNRNIDYRETELGYCYGIRRWITSGIWHGDISIDFTPTNNSSLINQAVPSGFNQSLLPVSIWWENTQDINYYDTHQEFNIRLSRANALRSNRYPNDEHSGHWGYGTKKINTITEEALTWDFAGYFECGSEGPIKINNTMWIQDTSGHIQNKTEAAASGAQRIDIIVHEYDSGLIDWRRMVDPTNQDYVADNIDKEWTVVSPELARDGMPAVNQDGRPVLHMDGSDYLIIRRTPGDEGEKCSYNIIRKDVRAPDSNDEISGTIEFKKLLDYLAQYDRLDGQPVFETDQWYIGAADWTVTAQGRYNLKYNETRFGGSGQGVRTIPSKGKWTFTQAELKDFESN